MYFSHFGLNQAPFKITPNTDFFFTGANRGAILQALVYAIGSGEGIIKVVGEVGSGKTMLCRVLQTVLPDTVEQVYLANPSVSPEDILYAIAFELQLELPANADKLRVMQVLQQYLLQRHEMGKQVVVFVEEAQGMPLATLEEIRLLSNLETRHHKLLQIVLFGQPELDANLANPNLRQLRERITQSFILDPISRMDVAQYVDFRLRSAGYTGAPLFTAKALNLLAKHAKGLVRRVNILADKAMLAAFSENQRHVDKKHVLAAIKDSEFGMQQIKKEHRFYLALGLLGAVFLLFALARYGSTLVAASAKQVSASPIQQPKTNSAEVQASTPSLAEQNNRQEINQQRNQAPTQANALSGNLSPVDEKVALHDHHAPITPLSGQKPETVVPSNTPAPFNPQLLQEKLEAGQAWLDARPETTASIQLLGSSNEALMVEQLNYLATRLNANQLFAYRTKVAGKSFVAILYGDFSSINEANQAIAHLPDEIGINQPQPRTVGGIRREISKSSKSSTE